MINTIYCQKLKKQAEALSFPPYPGELGQRIIDNISKEAWKMWLSRQTMFINEYRLNLSDAKAREFLQQEMTRFLFEDEDTLPEGYTPQNEA